MIQVALPLGRSHSSPAGPAAGYTLIELTIAMALTTIVAAVSMALWYFAEREMESMLTQVRINQEMRLVAHLLAEGGKQPGGTNWINGLNLHDAAELTPHTNPITLTTPLANSLSVGLNALQVTLQVWNNRLVLVRGGTDPTTLPFVASSKTYVTLQCRNPGIPHPDCTGTESRTVNGLIASLSLDPITRGTSGKTVEVEITLVDPIRHWDPNLLPSQFTESFRTILALD